MNKKSWIVTLTVVATLGSASAAVAAGASNQSKAYIGTSKAEVIALQKVSGVKEGIELELKNEHGKAYYEVDIRKTSSQKEVDVKVDAMTGKIITVEEDDNETEHQVINKNNTTKSGTIIAKTSNPSAVSKQRASINEEQASKLAVQAINGQVIRIKKDLDDGVKKYEVNMKTKDGIAEVEIGATNGKVLSIDYDDEHENHHDKDNHDKDHHDEDDHDED
ncbi:PepSY domain-containing protein [Paenibacillus sp. NPDC057886]|uniref:PepSY domain-containing protein n=1 Tax=Paenibacillus sp. NPDC057886 TaxID=3346270 RepID=UPI0036906735